MEITYYKSYAQSLNATDRVITWIGHNLANYLKSNPDDQGQVEHIVDYLVSDEAPKNMEKMSYEEALKNTEKWVAKMNKRAMGIQEKPEDTELVHDFGDGFKMVKLIGENAYKREGLLMSSCVASYYGRGATIYSLRDKNNNPHMTMEVEE